jgi:hypothetical protein
MDKKNWILWLFFVAINIPNGGLISVSPDLHVNLGIEADWG